MALAGVGINTVSGFTASIKYALQNSVENAAKEAQRLSTGEKIINAFEDAAGLAIGTGLEGDVKTLKVVLRGILQGQSALYIAEGAVKSLTEVSVRQKELTAAALSGVTSDRERGFIQLEFNALNQEIDRIADTTNFNGTKLIDGSISQGGNVQVNSQNLISGAGTSKLTYASQDIANTITTDINGVSFRYGAGITPTGQIGTVDVRKANELRIDLKDTSVLTAATEIFTLTVGGATIAANADAAEADSTATGFTVQIGTGPETAARMAQAINNRATGAGTTLVNFDKLENISARAEGSTLIIDSGKVFMSGTNTNANYGLSIPGSTATPPVAYVNSYQIGDNASSSVVPGTNPIVASITDYAAGKAVTIGASTGGAVGSQNDVVNGIAAAINNGVTGLDNYSASILSRLSATSLPDVTTPANARLTLESKDTGLNGRILVKNTQLSGGVVTNLPSLVGEYANGTAVGSLGISSVSVGGSLLADSAGNIYVKDLSFEKSSTGSVPLSNPARTSLVTDGAIFRIGNSGGNVDFVMKQNPVLENEVQIIGDPTKGTDDWKSTLVNLVNKLRASQNPLVQNLAYELNLDGDLKISSEVADDALNGMQFSILPSATAATASQTMVMQGGMAQGLNMANISGAPGFVGGINRSNVSALYESANKITLNITSPDGSITYSAKGVDVSAGGDVRLVSNKQNEGGNFRIQLKGNNSIADQNSADTFAASLGDQLAGLKFYQKRNIDSFKPSITEGTLSGAHAEMTSSSFPENLSIKSVKVTGTTSDNLGLNRSFIEIQTSDGRTFQNVFDPGETLQYISKGQKVTLVSVDANGVALNKDEKIDLFFGGSDVDMTSNNAVAALEYDLKNAFKAGQAPMKFQADSDASVVIDISIDALNTKALYKGVTYDVTTSENAREAGVAVDEAIGMLLAARDQIGSYESRFNYTIQSLQSYVQNMDSARSAFLDASMPDSVEGFAKENMKTQTAISVLKQIIQTQQQLVSLVQ